MKKTAAYLLLFLLCLGCKKEHKLTWEPLLLENTPCHDCPDVKINVPRVLDKTQIAKSVNAAIQEELIYALNFDGAEGISSMEGAMEAFTKSYHSLREKFGEETIGWEAEIMGDVVYEDENIITVQLNLYSFTGGAHGHSSTIFLNFEKQSGAELENYLLFNDYVDFESLAEKLFREQEDISKENNINTTGFMFKEDLFHLAENIGYTPEGIQLIYNPYEVTSYADGPVVVTVPYEKANPYLKYKVEP